VNGKLALSRGLGDFQFKKNVSLSPQDQIVTGNPDVICHEIMEDDEFFVLAWHLGLSEFTRCGQLCSLSGF